MTDNLSGHAAVVVDKMDLIDIEKGAKLLSKMSLQQVMVQKKEVGYSRIRVIFVLSYPVG